MPFTQISFTLCTCAFCSSQDKQPLLEWLAANYKKFGCNLEFITNKSDVGSQFCRGFGGIGGILRYQVGLAFVIWGMVWGTWDRAAISAGVSVASAAFCDSRWG